MKGKRNTSIFVAAFLITSFLFLTLSEKGFSGITLGGPPCCDFPLENSCQGGEDAPQFCDQVCLDDGSCVFFENDICVQISAERAACSSQIVSNIPALSHWGLIAMAVLFILVGVWAITRKKAEA